MKLFILIIGSFLVSQTSSFAADGSDKKYLCLDGGGLKTAGADAGAGIRGVANRNEGYYCLSSQGPKCGHPSNRGKISLSCQFLPRSGRDQVEVTNRSAPSGTQISTLDVSCYREDWEGFAAKNYGSHWLKEDASGNVDSCMLAAYPSVLRCPPGYEVVVNSTISSSLTWNGRTCSRITPPGDFKKPELDLDGNQ